MSNEGVYCDKEYRQERSRKKKNPRRFILITAVKFYSKMKTPTQKHFFGCASSLSLSLSKYRLVNKMYQQQYRQERSRKKKNPRRFVLITAVKFYSKMKTPNQKHFFGCDSSLSSSKYRLVNPSGIPTYGTGTTKRISSSTGGIRNDADPIFRQLASHSQKNVFEWESSFWNKILLQ